MAVKDKQVQSEVETPKTDFVKLVKDSLQAQGMSSFTRVNLQEEVSAEGLKMLNEEYSKQGYEVFSNSKSVLILKS